MSELNINWTEIERQDDGQLEVNSLNDVDIAVVNKIATVIHRLKIDSLSAQANPRLAAFANRPIKEKIAMGEFDTPRRFLRALSKQGKDKISLPCIYVSRDPSFGFSNLDMHKDQSDVGQFFDDDGAYLGSADLSILSLNFQVNIVGWQNDSIDAIALLLVKWLRHKHPDHSFTAKSIIAGTPIEIAIKFEERHIVSVENNSQTYEDDKLRALTFTITASAESYMVRYGKEVTQRYTTGKSDIL